MQKTHYTIKELPESERPYEKCEKYGASALSDAELLAVVIRTGYKEEHSVSLAMRVLNASEKQKGLLGLNYLSIKQLKQIKGIGKVKAIQLLCIAELTKRMAKIPKEKGFQMNDPSNVAQYYMQDMRHLTREEIILVMLDSKSNLLKDMIISRGTINSSLISAREIFICALQYSAVNIILLHNHPSGDPSPSKEDLNVTKRIQEVGNLVGIPLLDHVILGDNKYISLKQRGFL